MFIFLCLRSTFLLIIWNLQLLMWLQLTFLTSFFHHPFHIPFVFSKHLTWSCFSACWGDLSLHFWRIWAFGSPACTGLSSIDFCYRTWECKRSPSSSDISSYSCCLVVIQSPFDSPGNLSQYSNPICLLFLQHKEALGSTSFQSDGAVAGSPTRIIHPSGTKASRPTEPKVAE